MLSMGLDLEQPSREHCREERIPSISGGKTLEPRDGMEFESKEEAFSFYKDYATSVGFSAIIKASRRSRISGKFIDAKFVCTRYGTKREDSLPEMPYPAIGTDGATAVTVKRKRGKANRSWLKTDCKACMHVKRRQQDGRWVVRSFVKEHNHDIHRDQSCYFHNRERTRKVSVSLSGKSGGFKKNQNQKSGATNQSECLALEEGDFQVMLDHFTSKQEENPNFFYAMDLNEEQQLRNVFWVDAKARLDYGYFSDAIFIDTSFIKKEYKLPLIPFIGVNNHFQGLLVGCALVASTTKSTYVWLLQAWLRAMAGNAPRVILTDLDNCLKEAVAEVFLNSHHCFCLWHILSDIPEKLGYVIRRHENFIGKFNKCVLKSCSIEQFEKRWWKIVDKFGLRNDTWFLSLYEDRERWAPVYMRDKFLAGMSTSQRSESVSSLFDKLLQRRNTLKEFLFQQKTFLREKFEEQVTEHKQPRLKSPSPFGKQMATVYTNAIFKKFQTEVLGAVACHPRMEYEEGETRTFKVQDFEGNRDFVVVSNERDSQFSCSCRLFEFNGFLCRHILIVMQMSGVQAIPNQYILKRWTKDAKSRESTGEQSKQADSRAQRYNDLCRRALKLGDECSVSQESYNMALNAIKEAIRQCESVSNSFQSNQRSRKDVSRDKQVQSEPEGISTGVRENWKQLGHSRIRASVIDCSYEMQESIQGMDQLNSRASNLDSYFGSQQIADQSNVRSPHLHGVASKHYHSKYLSHQMHS